LRVRVDYLGPLRIKLRKHHEDVQLSEQVKLRELLLQLAQKHGNEFRTYVFDSSCTDIKAGFIVTVNGVLSGQLKGSETDLSDGDRIVIMPVISGG